MELPRSVRNVAKCVYQLSYVCPSVCLSVHIYQLHSHWTDFGYI